MNKVLIIQENKLHHPSESNENKDKTLEVREKKS